MKSVSISTSYPEKPEPAYLLMGFVNPKIAMPLFIKAAPVLIMGNFGLIYAVKEGLFDTTVKEILDYYYTITTSNTDARNLKVKIMTFKNLVTYFSGVCWILCHWYFVCLFRHLNYPGKIE